MQREVIEQTTQERVFRACSTWPVDQWAIGNVSVMSCRGHALGAQHCPRIGQQGIEEQSTGRRIGTVACQIGGKEAVRGADCDGGCALVCCRLGKRCEGGRVADPAIAHTFEAIELNSETPRALVSQDIGECKAASRRNGERVLSVAIVQPVITRRRYRRDSLCRPQHYRSARAVLEK